MKSKKVLSVLLSVLILISVLPVGALPVFGAEIVDSGTCGNDLTWTFDSDGLLTISGTGIMPFFLSSSSVPWYPNKSSIKNVIIADGVKWIGSNAFSYCTSLESITIPDSVTNIDDVAFYGCTSLNSITIPDGVTGIGYAAFSHCTSLESVSVTNGNSFTYIGNEAFENCTSLRSITIPNGVTYIGQNAFFGCASLESVTIGNSVTSIGWDAFSGCTSLRSITIGNSVTSIDDYVFRDCTSLRSITIGNSVTSIGKRAFRSCSSLESIIVESGNTVYHSSGNCLIETESRTLITGSNNSVIPSDGSVTSIGVYAFSYCTSLKSITIPDSVTSIGYGAFEDCTSLRSITIGNSVTSISKRAFSSCSSLESIIVESGNTVYHSSGNCLIETESRTLITGSNNSVIPSDGSVTSIGYGAFEDCTSLESITIPDSVTRIGWGAFYGCDNLSDVYYTGSEEEWNNIVIDNENDCLLYATIHYNYSSGSHTHTWGSGIVTKAATCAETGVRTYTCTVCGETKTETIAKTGIHTWNSGVVTREPTTTAIGIKTYTCTICGKTKSESIPKLPETIIDTATAKEISGILYAAPSLTSAELLSAAGLGAKILKADGTQLKSNENVGSGMTLVKSNGTKETIIVKGDNDGDGEVTASDARFALRTAVKLENPSTWEKSASEVDGKDGVTAADARSILRAAVKLETLKLY